MCASPRAGVFPTIPDKLLSVWFGLEASDPEFGGSRNAQNRQCLRGFCACARVITHFHGTDAIRFTVGSDSLPDVFRTFESLATCADEIGLSRIYGGFHSIIRSIISGSAISGGSPVKKRTNTFVSTRQERLRV
jgi:hypothetical protein